MWWLAVVLVPLLALAALWLIGERGHLMLPSTRRAPRTPRCGEGGGGGTGPRRRWGLLDAVHGYVYGRWTFQYIKVAIQ